MKAHAHTHTRTQSQDSVVLFITADDAEPPGFHMIYRWWDGCRYAGSLGCSCMTESLTTSTQPEFPHRKNSRTDERVVNL